VLLRKHLSAVELEREARVSAREKAKQRAKVTWGKKGVWTYFLLFQITLQLHLASSSSSVKSTSGGG
jgi:hypothetical protein